MADLINFKKTKLESWLEWKRECALAKCGTDTQSDIQDWASPKLRRLESNLAREWKEIEERALRTSDHLCAAWYEFEMYLKDKVSPKHGKRRKDVICDRAFDHPGDDAQRDSFEGQICTELLRAYRQDKVREQQKNWEIPFAPEDIVSIKPDSPDWDEVYGPQTEPAPGAVAAQEKLSELAKTEASAILSGFTNAERIVLVCKSLQIGLQKPEVLKAANCNKDQIYKAFESAATKFEATLKEMQIKHAQESDPEDWNAFWKEFTRSFRDFCEETVPPEILRLERS